MNLPPGFDPLALTEVSLNSCYFQNSRMELATARVSQLFPNAEQKWYLFHEDMSMGVLNIVPKPGLSGVETTQVFEAVHDFLPKGRYRGRNVEDYGDAIGRKAE